MKLVFPRSRVLNQASAALFPFWATRNRADSFGNGFPFASERKDEFAAGFVVSHHDVHLNERLVAAHFSCPFDGFQIQSRLGIADPVRVACVIEANFSMF